LYYSILVIMIFMTANAADNGKESIEINDIKMF
jgi:hypothetical protein